jgi:hypothetical protein
LESHEERIERFNYQIRLRFDNPNLMKRELKGTASRASLIALTANLMKRELKA